MRKMILLPMAVLLTASVCGTRERPQPILIPTPVWCVTGQLPPEPPYITGRLTGNEGLDIGLVAGSAKELRGWGQALFGLLNACRPPAPAPTPPAQ